MSLEAKLYMLKNRTVNLKRLQRVISIITIDNLYYNLFRWVKSVHQSSRNKDPEIGACENAAALGVLSSNDRIVDQR